MATKTEVILVCDLCGLEGHDSIATHTLSVDGRGVELEGCGKCWDKMQKALQKAVESGRKTVQRRRKAA